MSKPQNAVYAHGEDQASMDANLAYQEALEKLTQSLDRRKNRPFDPTWLAISQGFLKPGTSNFFESLGNVAENLGKVQEASLKEDQEIAQQRLELAGRGVELQRQKSKDAMVRRALSKEDKPPSGALPTTSRAETGEPSGARPAQGALEQAQGAAGREMGIQIAPGTPGISREEFFAFGIADGKSISDLAKEWEAIQRGRLQFRDNSLLDTGTGRFYAAPTGNIVEIQIFNRDGSTPKTFKVPANQAAELSELARNNDAEGYFALAERITQGPKMPSARPVAPAAPQQPAAPAAPTVSAPPQPVAVSPSAPSAVAQPAPAAVMPPAAAARVPAPQGGPQTDQGVPAAAARVPTPQAAAALPQAAPPVVSQAVPPVAARPAPVVAPPAAAAPTQTAPAPPTQAAAVAAAVPSAVAQAAPVAPSAPGRAAAAGATGRAGLMSVQESESIKAREKALQEADVQMEIESRKDFNQRFRDAGDSITMANMLRRFSEDPNASKMTGILNNEKISSGIARLVRDGVGARDFRIGIPAIEDVMRNAGLSPADQAKYRVFLMNTAQMRLQMSKYMKGSVSNYEQELMGEAAVSSQDTPQTIRMKADLLARRAQFDRKVYRAFKAAKMTAEEFLDSDQYEKMRDEYDEQLTRISVGELRYQPSTSNPATNAPARGAPRAAVPGAGQPSPGFIRDPQTGMIRRKRPGE